MTQSTGEPHILVAVDRRLTKAVYGRLDGEPIILAQNPSLLLNREQSMGIFRHATWAQKGDIYPLSLDAHVLEGGSREAELYAIGEAMDKARQRFGLPKGAPVVTVVVGNEATLRAVVEAQDVQASLAFNRVLLDEMIHHGKAASFLGAVLEDIEGIELRYLAGTLGELPPPSRGSDYAGLVDDARRLVSELRPTTMTRGSSRLLLKIPAMPLLYVSKGGEWSLLPSSGTGDGPGSATSRAIEAFRKERYRQGKWLRGVLLNVLAADLSLHSAADPPYLSWSERDEATKAGLEAILLDARVGIACLPDPLDGSDNLRPVYGV